MEYPSYLCDSPDEQACRGSRRRQHEGENLGNDRRRRASYERDTLVAGVPQEVQVGAPEPSGVPQFMQ
jgi:hypothetical protein